MSDKRKGSMWENGSFEDVSSSSVITPDFRSSRDAVSSGGSGGSRAPISIEERYDLGLFASPPRPPREPGKSRKKQESSREAEKRKKSGKERPGKRPSQRPAPERELPDWQFPERRPPAGQRRPGRDKPQPRSGAERRPKPSPSVANRKPMSSGARRAMITVIVMAMAVATAYLAVSMLFKVSEISITGDVAERYSQEQILQICEYQIGDNLVFLSTKDKARELEEQLPYVGKAEIVRHLPGTVEIRLTAAKAAASVSHNGSWLYISSTGKILEEQTSPLAGALQVLGLPLENPILGQLLGAGEPAEASTAPAEESGSGDDVFRAYETILEKLDELEAAGDFTLLDLRDLSNIRLLYQDRVEFQLGSAVELGYKVEFGYSKAVPDLGPKEKGVLDLSYADQTSKAYFTPGEVETAAAQIAAASPSDGGSQTAVSTPTPAPESGSGEDGAEPTPEPGQGSTRGEGIPDGIFTG